MITWTSVNNCSGSTKRPRESDHYPSPPWSSPLTSRDTSPCPKRRVSVPVDSFKQAHTLRLIRQAQLDLARGRTRPPTSSDVQLRCEDCERMVDDYLDDSEIKCFKCSKVVCRYCSVQRTSNNDMVECLDCVR